ncbi:MAG: tetratricopeptide repeat protein, partial [Proteobacteria bacterium]|nr:tetratricopeptide repeat protein [Pseudomonadota bacterium]
TRAQAAGAALLVLVLAGGVWLVYPQQDRSATFLPGESFRSDYERMAPDAISLTGVQWFHQRAFQDVYRLRDDVTAISLADFTFPWFYSPITQARFPRVVVPAGDVNYQAGQGWFLKRFLEANLDRKRDIYWEPFDLKGGVFSRHLKPELDLLFKVTPRPVDRLSPEETRAALGRLREKIEREIATEGFYEAEELDVYYVLMLFQYAFYFSRHGQIGAAMATLRFLEDLYGPEGANRMLPADHAALNINMGLMLASEQRWGEAVPRFEAALDHARGNFRFWFGLGLSLMKTGRLAKARSALERAAGLAPYDPETRLYLGDVFRLQGDTARARAAYERAWHLAREPRTKMEIKERLGELGG